jgi:hypothetical protein
MKIHTKVKMQYTFMVFFLLCIGTSVIAAPVSTVKGKIVELGQGNPVDVGDIMLIEKSSNNKVAYTLPKKDGSFILSGIKDGEYNLIIRSVGFDAYTRENIVLKNSTVLDLGQ